MQPDAAESERPEPARRRRYQRPAVVDFGDVERLTGAVSQPGTVAD